MGSGNREGGLAGQVRVGDTMGTHGNPLACKPLQASDFVMGVSCGSSGPRDLGIYRSRDLMIYGSTDLGI